MAKLLLLILAWLHSGCSFNIYGSTLGLPAPYASLPQPYSYNQQVGHSQVYTNGLVYGQMQPFLPYSPLAYLYQPYAIVRTGWDFTFAKNPPKDIDDCVHYFYACTDFQEPDTTTTTTTPYPLTTTQPTTTQPTTTQPTTTQPTTTQPTTTQPTTTQPTTLPSARLG